MHIHEWFSHWIRPLIRFLATIGKRLSLVHLKFLSDVYPCPRSQDERNWIGLSGSSAKYSRFHFITIASARLNSITSTISSSYQVSNWCFQSHSSGQEFGCFCDASQRDRQSVRVIRLHGRVSGRAWEESVAVLFRLKQLGNCCCCCCWRDSSSHLAVWFMEKCYFLSRITQLSVGEAEELYKSTNFVCVRGPKGVVIAGWARISFK